MEDILVFSVFAGRSVQRYVPYEYLPTEEERKKWEEADPEDREQDYLPQKYTALRLVPAYDRFIKERFNRQLDLYLAPRVQRVKLNIDPSALIPKLPSPSSSVMHSIRDLSTILSKIDTIYTKNWTSSTETILHLARTHKVLLNKKPKTMIQTKIKRKQKQIIT